MRQAWIRVSVVLHPRAHVHGRGNSALVRFDIRDIVLDVQCRSPTPTLEDRLSFGYRRIHCADFTDYTFDHRAPELAPRSRLSEHGRKSKDARDGQRSRFGVSGDARSSAVG